MVNVINVANPQVRPVPTVKGLPVIGSLPSLLSEQLAFLERARAEYGDIYRLSLGATSIIMLNHPAQAQYVLRDNVRNYAKGGAIWDSIRSLVGNGLVTSEGDFWMRQRRMMSPHFHRQRLAALTEVMVAAIADSLKNWHKLAQKTEPVDVSHPFAHVTMSIILRTMFGSDMSDEEFEDLGAKFAFVLDYLLPQAVTGSIPSWVPLPKRARFQQALKAIDAFIYGVIEKRRQTLSNDLISMLIESVDNESGDQMTNQQLRDEVITIFSAGYETTALTLSWTIHFITQQPAILERLREEVDSVLGDRLPTVDDLMRLPYARQVLQESMRLCPPAYFITRTAVEDDVIDGYRIQAGQMLGVTMYTIHRHPDFWASPQTFDPDRFSSEQSEGRHPMAWIPFGAGQRLCLGRDFAYMEGTLILAMLLQRFTISASPNHVATPRLSLTLHPNDGVMIHLKERAR
jgi:cytochrome P450